MAKGKSGGLFWLIGLCAFVALMCSGVAWLLGIAGITGGILSLLSQIAGIIITVCALFAGWVWLRGCSLGRVFKLILQILFIVFAVMAIFGHLGISF